VPCSLRWVPADPDRYAAPSLLGLDVYTDLHVASCQASCQTIYWCSYQVVSVTKGDPAAAPCTSHLQLHHDHQYLAMPAALREAFCQLPRDHQQKVEQSVALYSTSYTNPCDDGGSAPCSVLHQTYSRHHGEQRADAMACQTQAVAPPAEASPP
jgi:hypothetical protein